MLRFFRSVYHDNQLRRQKRRSLARDLVLYARNRALRPNEARLERTHCRPDLATGFIVAPPRSGTSLLFQMAARYLDLGYPTNFVARYWSCPLTGQKRYMTRHGIAPSEAPRRNKERDVPLASSYGGTLGVHSPHEFSWFWQFYTDFGDVDELTEEQLDAIDWQRIQAKIHGLAAITKSPWLFKSLNYTVYNIPRFARELPESRFIQIRRDPRFVVQSILKCRRERYGDEDLWWSLRPADVKEWLGRSGLSQVCHQVRSILRAIDSAFDGLPEHRKLRLEYEDLVADPIPQLERLADLLDVELRDTEHLDMSELRSGNVRHGDPVRFSAIEEHLANWEGY